MAAKAEELFDKLKKGDILPVYFLTGDESFLRNAALDLLLSRVSDPAMRDFNLSVFQGGDAAIDSIVGQASSVPMMSERRTVVVRNINQMDSSSLDALSKYAGDPVSTTVLILEGPSISGRSKLYGALKKRKALFDFKPMYENNVARWIKSYVKRQGKTIDASAIHILIETTGTDLQNLANELDKLVLFIGPESMIRNGDVNHVAGASRQYNIFEMQKALGRGDITRTLRMLGNMLTEGESAAGIIVMLSRYLSVLWKLSLRKDKDIPKSELAKAVGVPAFFLNDYISASGRYREANLEKAFEQLMFADLLVKRGAVNIPLTLTIPLLALMKPELFERGRSPLVTHFMA